MVSNILTIQVRIIQYIAVDYIGMIQSSHMIYLLSPNYINLLEEMNQIWNQTLCLSINIAIVFFSSSELVINIMNSVVEEMTMTDFSLLKTMLANLN